MSFPIEDIASAKTKIEEDLKLVATWFFENKLLINPEKTKLLLIGTRQLLGKLLEETTITFLGEEINALVMSKLYYCSTVWSNTSATNIKKLRAVQNFACRILSY